jgi:hypothetical protein
MRLPPRELLERVLLVLMVAVAMAQILVLATR